MKAEGQASPEWVPAEAPRGGQSAASRFALLAKRISSWTTKGLLSALILVAGLAFGRQVLDWWAADETGAVEPPPQLAMTDGLGDPTRAHQIVFGDAPWTILRETVVGGRDEAAAALRASCRELTIASGLPDDAIGPSEQRFLTTLSRQSPVAEEPGQWQLHEFEGGFPIVVGTRTRPATPHPTGAEQVAEVDRRVVTWGLAIPTPEQTWTLYTLHPTNAAGGPPTGFPEIPLPPDSTKTLSMRALGGGSMVAFIGPPEGGRWRRFFDQWFREHEWTPAGDWTRSGSTWHLRYARSGRDATQTVDVQFGPDGRGRLTGLVMITPTDGKTATSEGS